MANNWLSESWRLDVHIPNWPFLGGYFDDRRAIFRGDYYEASGKRKKNYTRKTQFCLVSIWLFPRCPDSPRQAISPVPMCRGPTERPGGTIRTIRTNTRKGEEAKRAGPALRFEADRRDGERDLRLVSSLSPGEALNPEQSYIHSSTVYYSV